MTYPEPGVVETVNDSYIALQINTKETEAKPLVERFRQVWTPDVRFIDADGFEFYRWNGYLPPFEFLPQMLAAEAQAYFRQKLFKEAAELYDKIIERFPTSRIAPEAAYYGAVANYRASDDPKKLSEGWKKLRSLYPLSDWRLRQIMIEDKE